MSSRIGSRVVVVLAVWLCLVTAGAGQAAVVTFGTGSNSFSMEFVPIGNPNNAPDTTGSPNPGGQVAYEYGIGKFEVTKGMIVKFNASQSLQIPESGGAPSGPATIVSWNQAARFINWLNTVSGGHEAYKFTTSGVNDNISVWTSADVLDYDPANPYRSKRATYAMTSLNEWYKAAYYDPKKQVYYDYPTGSNTAPASVAQGDSPYTAVYGGRPGPVDVTQAGGLSPYGVMGLGGNVFEWQETALNFTNSSGSSQRWFRGGAWYSPAADLYAPALYLYTLPSNVNFSVGFRVTSLAPASEAVPEPGTFMIGTCLLVAALSWKRARARVLR